MSERFEIFADDGKQVIKDNEQLPHLLDMYKCCVRLNEFVERIAELEKKLVEKEQDKSSFCVENSMENLEYYVLLPNINDERNYKFNIFHSSRFLSCLMDLKARTMKDNTINIKEEVKHSLQYSFWAKAEYEIMVKLLFGKEEHKIDVYEQIMLNYDLFYEYLISNWKHISAKTYRQQSNQRKKQGRN